MKRTAYRVEGVLDYLPGTLPTGLSVTEVEVDDPKRVEVHSVQGSTRGLTVEPTSNQHPTGGADVRFAVKIGSDDQGVWISLDSARQVRDCLNAILGEDEPKRRVFAEEREKGGSWRWWETAPGKWTYETSWEDALLGVTNRDTLLVNVDWDTAMRQASSTLVDVTSEHPEVNQ